MGPGRRSPRRVRRPRDDSTRGASHSLGRTPEADVRPLARAEDDSLLETRDDRDGPCRAGRAGHSRRGVDLSHAEGHPAHVRLRLGVRCVHGRGERHGLSIYHLTRGPNLFHGLAVASLAMTVVGIAQPLYRSRFRRWMWRHYQYMCWSYVGLLTATVNEAAVRVPVLRRITTARLPGMPVIASACVVAAGALVIFTNQRRTLASIRPAPRKNPSQLGFQSVATGPADHLLVLASPEAGLYLLPSIQFDPMGSRLGAKFFHFRSQEEKAMRGRRTLVSVAVAMGLGFLLAPVARGRLIDFNNPNDLANNFRQSTSGVYTTNTTDGLASTGSVRGGDQHLDGGPEQRRYVQLRRTGRERDGLVVRPPADADRDRRLDAGPRPGAGPVQHLLASRRVQPAVGARPPHPHNHRRRLHPHQLQ